MIYDAMNHAHWKKHPPRLIKRHIDRRLIETWTTLLNGYTPKNFWLPSFCPNTRYYIVLKSMATAKEISQNGHGLNVYFKNAFEGYDPNEQFDILA